MSSSELTQARVARIREVANRRQHDLTVFMERVHKPHNVAAIIRTCDAVGIATTHAVPGDEGISRSNHIAQGAQRWVHLNRHDNTTAGLGTLKAKALPSTRHILMRLQLIFETLISPNPQPLF